MTAEPEPPRWLSRLDTFRRAVDNLAMAVEQFRQRPFSVIEKAGLVQLYEVAWELGWKVQADYLRSMGHQIQLVGPRPVIRAAFEAGLIENGQGWVDATKLRNELPHIYDAARADAALEVIAESYLPLMMGLVSKLDDADTHSAL